MLSFFSERRWMVWSWGGAVLILASLWYTVQLDVQINEFFGSFYDLIQKALSEPNSVTLGQYFVQLITFGEIAGTYVAVALGGIFFTSHWLFRWRTAMVQKYHTLYHKARKLEGASQRVQEDTVKFSRLLEELGTTMIESVMLLVAFLPILLGLSSGIVISFFGDWQYGLVTSAVVWSLGITVVLLVAGWALRLVNLEYDIQKQEAAYRKILVKAEDDGSISPKTFAELYDDVRKIHYKNYFRYLWFNIARLSMLQANVLVPYVLLAPAIVSGAITLGVMQQIIRAFGKVEGAMMYIFKSWPSVIELLSVYKRLREFEEQIKETK